MMPRCARSSAAAPMLEALEARLMLDGAGLIINEFMASNAEYSVDEDGDSSDWIELWNDADDAVDLTGWYLTDDPDNLLKWAFPTQMLDANGYLLVFASDKDRAVAGEELHTNFKLSADGEYLALAHEDGELVSVVHEFAPEFPPQVSDISYGLGCTAVETTLVETGDGAIAWVPSSDKYDQMWMERDFPWLPSEWMEGTTGVGYEHGIGYESLIGLDVDYVMAGVRESVYIRITFTVDDVEAIGALKLRMKYDDGFIAYLNGEEVATANYERDPELPPELYPGWQTGASASHPDSQALAFEEFDITSHADALEPGTNVLAIHGLNFGAYSADMLILPELIGWIQPPDQPEPGWRYFQVPTPGAMNTEGFLGYVDSPDASVTHGLFDEPITVTLASETPDAIIRYTTDCSEPTETHGTLYTPGTPITVQTSTVLRTIAYLPEGSGWRPSATTTYTYVFPDDVLAQSNDQLARGFPVQWIAGIDHYTHYDRQIRDADYAVDPTISLDAGDLMTIPSMSLVMDQTDLWDPFTGIYPNSIQRASSNPLWEKAASLEWIDPYGADDGFTINAGARINGELSRWAAVNNKQSFRIVFQGDYGPTKLRTNDLFGGGAADAYDTLVLRAMWGESFLLDETRGEVGPDFLGGDPTTSQYLRDLYSHEAYAATGNLAPRGEFVHLYLNGLYWGLYQVTERPDDSFNAAYRGGNPDDYDVIKGHVSYTNVNGGLQDGERWAWNELFSYFDTNPDGTNIEGQETPITDPQLVEVAKYLDLEAFADYMITLWVSARYDFPRKNWYAACKRGDPGEPPEIPFRFYTWDSEASLGSPGAQVALDRWTGTDAANDTGPVRLYRRLRHNATFQRLWMDRVYALLFNGGPLSTEANGDRYENLADDLDKAIVGESARWGDSAALHVDDPLTYGEHWMVERDRILDEFFTQRNDIVLDQMESAGMWTDVLPAEFNQDGGTFEAGFTLTMTDPVDDGGVIWYTLNDTDPRDATSTPIRYTGPIPLTGPVVVKAAIENGGQWSALHEAVFQPLDPGPLVITEINYNPIGLPGDGTYNNDDFEFIELVNNSDATIDLDDYAFVDGIEFDFPSEATLDAGDYVLVVRNAAAFASRYDTTDLAIAGEYTGALSNGGERITLNANGALYCTFTYDDDAPWPGRADGKGATLEPVLPGDLNDDDTWRSSGEFLGTPGAAGQGLLDDVIINEVLTHTDAPLLDAIELHNTTAGTIDLSGWYLSDTWTHYKKFRIPDGTTITAGGYVTFDEHDFNPGGLTADPADDSPNDFALNGARGDDVWLMAADPVTGALIRFVDHVDFGPAAAGVALGLWPDVDGRLVPMTAPTLGAVNSGPLFAPVIINEVMYHTPDTDLEFIELYNPSGSEADISGWRLDDAVEFTFDAGTSLAAETHLVVLPFDPVAAGNAARLAAFEAAYDLPEEVTVVGGWTGHLDNTGERIELLRPDDRPANKPHIQPFVLAEEATFDDDAPWPVEAAGGGSSLGRIDVTAWGSDPANWEAVTPSPGAAEHVEPPPPLPGDADLDGDVDLDDFVVLKQNFGTPTGADWAHGDFTGDGAVDLDDFVLLKQNFGTVAPVTATVNVLAELRVDEANDGAASASARVVAPARRAERTAVRRLRPRAGRRESSGGNGLATYMADLMRLTRPLG
ncbi:MAG: lamin tail domain-containing protein [Planctomycetota bacterium]